VATTVRFRVDRRDDPAYRRTVLSAVDQARASPFPPFGARFGRSLNPLSSVLFDTLDKLSHGRFRVAGKSSADALEEPVIPESSSRNGLFVSFTWRFGKAG
jgi:hypothetical protein